MAIKRTPPSDETFTNYEIGENVARELVLRAETLAEQAKKGGPNALAMVHAAAAALTAATPFLDKKDKRRFAV